MCTAKISRKGLSSSVTNSPFSVDSCGHACSSLRIHRQSIYTCLHFRLVSFSLFDPLLPCVRDIPDDCNHPYGPGSSVDVLEQYLIKKALTKIPLMGLFNEKSRSIVDQLHQPGWLLVIRSWRQTTLRGDVGSLQHHHRDTCYLNHKQAGNLASISKWYELLTLRCSTRKSYRIRAFTQIGKQIGANLFFRNSNVHNYNTRNISHFKISTWLKYLHNLATDCLLLQPPTLITVLAR